MKRYNAAQKSSSNSFIAKGVDKLTKLEKDTILDAVLIFYELADGNQEKFIEAIEKFRSEKVTVNLTKDNKL